MSSLRFAPAFAFFSPYVFCSNMSHILQHQDIYEAISNYLIFLLGEREFAGPSPFSFSKFCIVG